MNQPVLSPEGRLLLSCARTYCDPEHSVDSSVYANPQLDWTKLLRLAKGHNILPILAAKLVEHPMSESIPEGPHAQIKRTRYAAICHDARFRAWMSQVLDRLSSAGIEPIILKGPVLADYLYPSSYVRLSCDLDLLIQPEDLVTAGRALLESGYALKHHLPAAVDELKGIDLSPLNDGTIPVKSAAFSRRHDYHLSFEGIVDGVGRLVELHWKPTAAKSAVLPVDKLWERKASIEISGRKAYALAPEHQVSLLIFHLIGHGWEHGFLRRLLDLSLMIASWPEMDWDEISRHCEGQTASGHAYHVLTWASEYLGAPVPGTILSALKPTTYLKWSSRPFRRFEDVIALHDSGHAVLDLKEGLAESDTIAEKAKFLLGVVLPPPSGLAQMQALPAGSRLYMSHWIKLMIIPYQLLRHRREDHTPGEATTEELKKIQLSDRSRLFRFVERTNTIGSSLRAKPGIYKFLGRTINFACARGFDLFTICLMDIRRMLCPVDLSRIAAARAADASSEQQKADELCRYVFESIAYARSVTWLDPPDVVRLGYGDCKCHARLLQDLLAAAGIEGRVVVGITGRRASISKIHAWVEAHIDGRTMVCDATLCPNALDPAEYDRRTGGILDVTPEYAMKRFDTQLGIQQGE